MPSATARGWLSALLCPVPSASAACAPPAGTWSPRYASAGFGHISFFRFLTLRYTSNLSGSDP